MPLSSINPTSVIGGFLAVPGSICFCFAVAAGRELRAIRETPTSRVADLAGLVPGSQVEASGILRCETPLSAPYSGARCAWFAAKTMHDTRERDADGKTQSETYVVDNRTGSVPGRIEEASGSVALVLDGARVDGEQTVRERWRVGRSTPEFSGTRLAIGAGRVWVGGNVVAVRREEMILDVDAPAYVLAVLRADGTLGAAEAGGRGQFLVSRRSEVEFTRAKAREHRILTAISALTLPGALVGLGLGLLAWLVR